MAHGKWATSERRGLVHGVGLRSMSLALRGELGFVRFLRQRGDGDEQHGQKTEEEEGVENRGEAGPGGGGRRR